MRLFLAVVCLSCVCVGIDGSTSLYIRDRAVKVEIPDPESWHILNGLLRKHLQPQDIDIWKEPSVGGHTHLRIPGHAYDVISAEMVAMGLSFEVTIENVGEYLQTMKKSRDDQHKPSQSIVGTFATYSEILQWFEDLKANYSFISTQDIGFTYEGTVQRIMKISTGGSNKWAIYVEGGTHAREWIAPATAIYIADQLIQGYANGDPEISQWVDTFDWYFLPSANPDGYEYTFSNDRLWRKNRRPNDDLNSTCVGTDLNRNYEFEWGEVGSSANPCDYNYKGTGPNSEVEVQNIVNFIGPQSANFIWYMSYHCWGQQFFTRWSNDATPPPPDHEELLNLAWTVADTITGVHGMYHEAGTAADIMYAFSGSSSDWARGIANIRFSFLEELRDNGTYSFELPPEQIIPTGEENWAGFQVVAREVMCVCAGVTPPGPCPAGPCSIPWRP